MFGLTGCGLRSEDRAAERGDPEPVAAAPDAVAPSSAEGSGWDPTLDAVWADAIAVDPTEENTYVVDSFVAAWLFARADAGPVPEWTLLEGDQGYRLNEIPPGAPYDELGLQAGDVVESLNGVVLGGPARFGFALDGAESLVVLSIRRGSSTRRVQMELRPGAAWSSQLARYSGQPDPRVDPPADVGDDGDAAPDGTVPAEAPRGRNPGSSDRPAPSSRPRPSSGSSSPGSSPGRGSTPRPSTPDASPKVRCESPARCSIDAAHFRQLVASPSRLQSQLDVVPAIRNDVFSGYRIKSVKPGSDVARLGFRAGDKITHVNGHDLTNESEALQLYVSLGATKLFKVRYERGTQRLVKTITVQ